MAILMEHECGYQGLVGLIDNGRCGFPDPHKRCARCGEEGNWHPIGLHESQRALFAGLDRSILELDEHLHTPTIHRMAEDMHAQLRPLII